MERTHDGVSPFRGEAKCDSQIRKATAMKRYDRKVNDSDNNGNASTKLGSEVMRRIDTTTTRICIPPYADRFFNFDNIHLQSFFDETLHLYGNIREVIIELSRLEVGVNLDPILNFIETTSTITKIVLSGGAGNSNMDNNRGMQILVEPEHNTTTFPNYVDETTFDLLHDFSNGQQQAIRSTTTIGDDGTALHFLRAMANNLEAIISEIRFYNINIPASEMAYFLLSKQQQQKHGVRRLWFHCCNFIYQHNYEIDFLAHTIGYNETIQNLSFNSINPYDLSIILNCVSENKENSNVEELDLSNVNMAIVAPCIMSILLSLNSTAEETSSTTKPRLKHLSFNGCNFDHESFSTILSGIQQNSTLKRFHIVNGLFSYNTIGHKHEYINSLNMNNLTLQQISILGNVTAINTEGAVMNDNDRSIGTEPFLNRTQKSKLELCCVRNRRLQEIVEMMVTSSSHPINEAVEENIDGNIVNRIPPSLWPLILSVVNQSSSKTTILVGQSMTFHSLRIIMDDGFTFPSSGQEAEELL